MVGVRVEVEVVYMKLPQHMNGRVIRNSTLWFEKRLDEWFLFLRLDYSLLSTAKAGWTRSFSSSYSNRASLSHENGRRIPIKYSVETAG